MRRSLRHIATAALMLTFGVAGAYAQSPVRMTFSGSSGPSAISLEPPNANTFEENVAGNGTLGAFTFRNISETASSPQPSATCAGVFVPRVAGGGVIRFRDGSLLTVALTPGGGDCIDGANFVAHCTLTLQITGGTGRFEKASGFLTYTETARPVLADALHNPVLFTETGTFTGTISRAGDPNP